MHTGVHAQRQQKHRDVPPSIQNETCVQVAIVRGAIIGRTSNAETDREGEVASRKHEVVAHVCLPRRCNCLNRKSVRWASVRSETRLRRIGKALHTHARTPLPAHLYDMGDACAHGHARLERCLTADLFLFVQTFSHFPGVLLLYFMDAFSAASRASSSSSISP